MRTLWFYQNRHFPKGSSPFWGFAIYPGTAEFEEFAPTLLEAAGAAPFVPFKVNSQDDGSPAWRKMRAVFMFKQDEFLAAYAKRARVESTFSAVKRKFGQSVKSKTFTAQTNEILCKILAHNLTCLVLAMRALGIEPSFLASSKVPA